MNLKPLVIAAAAAIAMPAAAQINSPQAKGYVARASAMLSEGNYQGCLDQCAEAMRLGTPEREQVMWMSAQAAFKGGFADAGPRISAFLKAFPASAHRQPAMLMAASMPFFAGNYAMALARLEKVSSDALDQDSAEDLDYRMAFCCLKLGEYDCAESLLNGLASTSRYGNAATFYLGYVAYVKGDYQKASQLFESVNPDTQPGCMAPYYLAQINFSRKNFKRAAELARPLIESEQIDPEFTAEARRITGESLYALGSETEALKLLRVYMDSHSDKAPLSTRYIIGVQDYREGSYDTAISQLQPVTAMQDAMGQSASLYLGLCYLGQGNNAAALMAFEKSLRLDIDPEVTESAYYNYAVAKVEGGRIPFGSSVQTLEEFVKKYPSSRYASTVQEYLVKGYIATDDYEAALRSINAMKSHSDAVTDARQRVHFVLGTRHFSAGRYNDALAQLRLAEQLSARNPEIARQTVLWLGDTYYALGDYDAAEKQYRSYVNRAQRNDPNLPLATYNLGYALFGRREYAAARDRLVSAAKSTSLSAATRADAHNRIADTYYYEHKFQDALDNYGKAYDTNRSTGDYAALQSAMMLGHLGRKSDKVKALDRMTGEFPQSSLVPSALTEKALTLSSMGKRADAISVYRSLSDDHPSTSQGRNALLQLAILSANDRDRDQAITYYKKVISSYPSSAEASMAVEDLTRIYGEMGAIEQLHEFLSSVKGAPQLDSVEFNAIASAALLKKARGARDAGQLDSALVHATDLLDRFPDSESAEKALAIKADVELTQGKTEPALNDYMALADRASTPAMSHRARMGILRSARDLGRSDLMISTADAILGSSAGADTDIPEVSYLQACAYFDTDRQDRAREIWGEMARTPANIYGTRAAFSLAESYLAENMLDDALATANGLIDANPPHQYWVGRTFILLSDILRAKGSTFEADEYLRVLRSNYPGSEPDIFQMIDLRLPQQ